MNEYEVKDGKRITVRKEAKVGTNDYVGELSSGAQFFGKVERDTGTEIWVKITEGLFTGFFGAVRYKNEDFADLISSTPDSEVLIPEELIIPIGGKSVLYRLVEVIEDAEIG